MGIGEPLDNFDNVMRFLTLVNHPDGLNIGTSLSAWASLSFTPSIMAYS